jgi:hypothetical protein
MPAIGQDAKYTASLSKIALRQFFHKEKSSDTDQCVLSLNFNPVLSVRPLPLLQTLLICRHFCFSGGEQ